MLVFGNTYLLLMVVFLQTCDPMGAVFFADTVDKDYSWNKRYTCTVCQEGLSYSSHHKCTPNDILYIEMKETDYFSGKFGQT